MAIAKINGRQVNLLISLFIQAGINKEMARLEWIEEECYIEVNKLEDINTGQMPLVVNKLKKNFNLE